MPFNNRKKDDDNIELFYEVGNNDLARHYAQSDDDDNSATDTGAGSVDVNNNSNAGNIANVVVPVILVIDDVTMHLMRAREILERDYEVVLAKSGTSALNQLRRTKADVILVDIEMPDMSGFDFIRKAREAMPGIIDTPMLFVTSHATREFIMEANEVGVADYILKPYTPNNLCSKIRVALKNRKT